MTTLRRQNLALLALATWGLGVCQALTCDGAVCGPCMQPITFFIESAGASVESVSIDGPLKSTCDYDLGVRCFAGDSRTEPGTYVFVVKARDHVEQTVSVVVAPWPSPDSCCSCGYQPTQVKVTLVPQG